MAYSGMGASWTSVSARFVEMTLAMTELERLIADLATNPELTARLARLPAADVHMAASVLNAEGYRITAADLTVAGMASSDRLQPLADSELDAVAGGSWSDVLNSIRKPGLGYISGIWK